MAEETHPECVYKGETYSPGSWICMNGRMVKCVDGEWKGGAIPCSEADGTRLEKPPDDVDTRGPLMEAVPRPAGGEPAAARS